MQNKNEIPKQPFKRGQLSANRSIILPLNPNSYWDFYRLFFAFLTMPHFPPPVPYREESSLFSPYFWDRGHSESSPFFAFSKAFATCESYGNPCSTQHTPVLQTKREKLGLFHRSPSLTANGRITGVLQPQKKHRILIKKCFHLGTFCRHQFTGKYLPQQHKDLIGKMHLLTTSKSMR